MANLYVKIAELNSKRPRDYRGFLLVKEIMNEKHPF